MQPLLEAEIHRYHTDRTLVTAELNLIATPDQARARKTWSATTSITANATGTDRVTTHDTTAAS